MCQVYFICRRKGIYLELESVYWLCNAHAINDDWRIFLNLSVIIHLSENRKAINSNRNRIAGVHSMTTLMRRQTAIACEKAARLTPYHSRRRLLNSPVRHRLVQPSWRSAAYNLIKELPRTLTSREPLPDQTDCP